MCIRPLKNAFLRKRTHSPIKGSEATTSEVKCSVSAHPLVVQSLGDLDSTCGSLGRSHHRTAAGPTETHDHGQCTDQARR